METLELHEVTVLDDAEMEEYNGGCTWWCEKLRPIIWPSHPEPDACTDGQM